MDIALLFALIVLNGLFGWEGWHLEVINMDGKTIDKVRASRVPEGESVDDGAYTARS